MKSDARRARILAVAREVFNETGYEGASMSRICARLGGSKATLYAYFDSKADLFAAAIVEAEQEDIPQIVALLDADEDDVHAVMTRAGLAYARHVLGEGVVSVTRTVLAPGVHEAVRRSVFERGPMLGMDIWRSYLDALIAAGRLPPSDTRLAALHLRGLLDAGLREPALFGVEPAVAVGEAVPAAVSAFLKIYGAR